MSYELPSGKSPSFVAYGAPETIPAPDGTATTGRPQIYVRWFDSIKILNIKDGGRTGKGDTVGIEFDHQSVGFDNPVNAYMNPNDPTLSAIREAHATGAGIQIALESVRKVKAKSTGEPIAKTTPIHALRGALQDGSKGKMDASGDNIRNLVAMVDGMTTETINSDPREWKFLAKNRTGEIAPPGWRYVGDKEDWTKLGVIIQSSHQNPGTSTMDESSIAAIAAAVADILGGTNGGINSNEIAREVRRGVFNEGKPWNARTSNGMVNLGSYLLAKSRVVFEEALAITADKAEASELTRRILCITDTVQADTYGNNIKADRLAPSHAEAGKWVSFVLKQGAAAHYPLDAVSDQQEFEARKAARDQWCVNVATAATSYFSGAAQIAREYLESLAASAVVAGSVEDPEAPEASAGESTESGDQRAIESSAGGDPVEAQKELARSLAGALTAKWNDAVGLAGLRVPISTQNLVNAPIAIAVVDGATVIKPSFDVEGEDGWSHGTVVNFVNRRLGQLQGPSQVVAGTSAPQVPAEAQVAAQGQGQPIQEPVQLPLEESANETTPPVAVAVQESSTKAAEGPVAQAAYPEDVEAIVNRLKAATADEMGGIFADASSANLLDQRVAVRPVGRSVEFGKRGEVGYAELALSQIITRMVENLGASAAAENQTAREQEVPAEPAATTATAVKAKTKAKAEPVEVAPEPAAVETATPEVNDVEAVESGDGDTSPAQAIADKAIAMGTDVEGLTKLMEETVAKGLADQEIIAGEMEGGLIYFLQHSIDEASKALATV